jgi:hypothetical protein
LTQVDLDSHAGFDVLDRFLAASTSAGDILRVYEDLARIASGSRLVLFRAGVAAASLVEEDKGLPVARGILKALERDDPMDCNARFLEAEIAKARLMGPDGTLRVRNENVDAAQVFIRAMTQLQGACPDWEGPHGASIPNIRASIDMVIASARELAADALDRPLPVVGAPPIEPAPGMQAGDPQPTQPSAEHPPVDPAHVGDSEPAPSTGHSPPPIEPPPSDDTAEQ